MAERVLRFSVKVKPFGAEAAKDVKKVTDELKKTDAAAEGIAKKSKKRASEVKKEWHGFSKEIEESRKALTKLATDPAGFQKLLQMQREVERQQKKLTDDFNKPRGFLGGIARFNGALSNAASLRNLLLGSAVVRGAMGAGSFVLGEGQRQLRAERLAKREFGDETGSQLLKQGDYIGKRAGIQGDDATRGLIEIRRAIEADENLQAGKFYKGKKLTDASAKQLKDQLMGFGSQLFERAATLNPDVDPAELGRLVAQAGTGKEGLKGLVSALGINKAVAARIEREGEKKNLGRGDILKKLFDEGGLSEKVAEDERKTKDFQLRALKAEAADVAGDKAANALRASQGPSATLGFLRRNLPGAADFLTNNLGAIGGAVAGYGALSGVAGYMGANGKLSGGAGGAAPVYVTNAKEIGGDAGGIVGAIGGLKTLLAGVVGTTAAVGGVGVAGGINLAEGTLSTVQAGVVKTKGDEHAAMLADLAAKKKARVAEFEAAGVSHGMAVYNAEQEQKKAWAERSATVVTQVNLDGKKVAEVVTEHQARKSKNATANGAAQ